VHLFGFIIRKLLGVSNEEGWAGGGGEVLPGRGDRINVEKLSQSN
jgi:hypothetical protein